ncbi:hypothetical protein PF004_g3402 [Phytophthora fragariae]|uniref:Uncharacterized protein n=1 Tax=Phytophthora fragariae TaxID=53985 RepID=A0A6G0PLY6_9STRA|nr:hypothetical protein PF004_g3402 [Phytophthora fragariae]
MLPWRSVAARVPLSCSAVTLCAPHRPSHPPPSVFDRPSVRRLINRFTCCLYRQIVAETRLNRQYGPQ